MTEYLYDRTKEGFGDERKAEIRISPSYIEFLGGKYIDKRGNRSHTFFVGANHLEKIQKAIRKAKQLQKQNKHELYSLDFDTGHIKRVRVGSTEYEI